MFWLLMWGLTFGRTRCGRGVDPANNLPLPHVAPARFDGDEPSLFDEDLRQAQGCFFVPDGVRPVGIDFLRGDGDLGPVINEPNGREPF